jgi:hypothetical protein
MNLARVLPRQVLQRTVAQHARLPAARMFQTTQFKRAGGGDHLAGPELPFLQAASMLPLWNYGISVLDKRLAAVHAPIFCHTFMKPVNLVYSSTIAVMHTGHCCVWGEMCADCTCPAANLDGSPV